MTVIHQPILILSTTKWSLYLYHNFYQENRHKIHCNMLVSSKVTENLDVPPSCWALSVWPCLGTEGCAHQSTGSGGELSCFLSLPVCSTAWWLDLCVSFSASSTTPAKTSTLKSTVRRDTVLRSWHQDRLALNLRSRLCCRHFEDSTLSPQAGVKLTWPSHSNSWPAETAENKCSLSKDATRLGLLFCLTNAR